MPAPIPRPAYPDPAAPRTVPTARRYFDLTGGVGDALGRVLRVEGYPIGEADLTVTGVLRDLPPHTDGEPRAEPSRQTLTESGRRLRTRAFSSIAISYTASASSLT